MKKGFTLIELLIVIAVISILIGIALPRFRGMQEEGNIAKAKGELRTLQTAVESYYIHNNNTYPTDFPDDLENDSSATGPKLIGETAPTDPFNPGNDYGYFKGGAGDQYYVIYSVGLDGDGSATITDDEVVETNGSSCIYVSNAGQDSQP
jgi:type II secretion system protein G